MQTILFDLSKIKLSGEYLRLDTDVESLQKSIEKIGLINPLTINKEDELLAGARRYQALKNLGIAQVPVHVVDRKILEQELISIDENLVRKSLDKMELETYLNRGREIYEKLNPQANKIELNATSPESPAEKKRQKEMDDLDHDSFAAVASEKTGLSKSIIKGAIKRDALASNMVKEARGSGVLSASQTNEIIKLSKEEQDHILPLISDKTVKEARKIIKKAKIDGIEAAHKEAEAIKPIPKEYSHILNLSKRLSKNISRVLLEELSYDGEEKGKIVKEVKKLHESLGKLLEVNGEELPQMDHMVNMSSTGEQLESAPLS